MSYHRFCPSDSAVFLGWNYIHFAEISVNKRSQKALNQLTAFVVGAFVLVQGGDDSIQRNITVGWVSK